MTFYMLYKCRYDITARCSSHQYATREQFEWYMNGQRRAWQTYEFIEIPLRCLIKTGHNPKNWYGTDIEWRSPWPVKR